MTPFPTSSLSDFVPLSDSQYISGLKSGDSKITHSFFYDLCRYPLADILHSLMDNRIDYDDIVNELYLYLSEDNWRKLDTFKSLNQCRLSSWMSVVAWRYFMQARQRLLSRTQEMTDDGDTAIDKLIDVEIEMDVNSTFAAMPNKRYVEVLRLMLVEGYGPAETAKRLETTVDNIYTLKRRAIVQFISIYKDKEK